MRLTSPTMFLLVLMLSTPFLVKADGCQTYYSDSNDFLFSSSSDNLPSLRSVFLSNRTDCGPGDEQPFNRVNTTERVDNLIDVLLSEGYDAYIITSGDSHQSEYVAPADKRREYISGFSGSSGTAVVLINGTRAVWADGRYFIQAEQELDCNWLFMRDESPGVPSVLEFLQENLAPGSVVSGDATLLGYNSWLNFEAGLAESGISMVPSTTNLVDVVWDNDLANPRPDYPSDPAIVHDIAYAGKTVAQKLIEVRAEMSAKEAQVFFVTALDDVSWLYNVRARDIPYNPVLRGYGLVTDTSAYLYVNSSKITADVSTHLTNEGVEVRPYEDALIDLATQDSLPEVTGIMLPDSSYTQGCSYQVYQTVSDAKRKLSIPPTLTMKAEKNDVEIEQMRAALVRDSVALSDFLAFLETEITAGSNWTELEAESVLRDYRLEQEDAMDISFGTISAYAEHSAVIHYKSSEDTNVQIGTDSLYMVDSGGQYLGATTDVTRTLHYGTPTAEMINMYTRVIMGTIDFCNVVFPAGTTSTEIDILARRPIYDVGMDYRHGTSHGIGMYLNVHEPKPRAYKPGYVMSDEPGYYREDGAWGIRIENQIYTVETQFEFDVPYYGFDVMTLVPFEPKLIDETMFTDDQIDWLNSYYETIRTKVGQMMLDQGRNDGYQWLLSKTEPISKRN